MIEDPRRASAEEQLLRMIEGTPGAGHEAGAAPGAGGAPGAWWQRLATRRWPRLPRWTAPSRNREPGDVILRNLRRGTRILWSVLAILGAYVVFGVLLARPSYGPSIMTRLPAPSTADVPAVVPDDLGRPVTEYLAAMLERNPFTGASGLARTVAPVRSAREKLKELSAGLVVVGIDRGEHPEALLEDAEHQKTYFVKVGDAINGLRVKEISARGVIVSYEHEELLIQ